MCMRVSYKKKYFFCIHKVTEERSRIRDLDPDLLVRGTDPWIRIRTEKSRIPNTGSKCNAYTACAPIPLKYFLLICNLILHLTHLVSNRLHENL
jgi:hypothetical protein